MTLYCSPLSVHNLAVLSSDELSKTSTTSNVSLLRSRGQAAVLSDPFSTATDGHIVGDDGFVVPRDSAEFFERFPRYVHNFVRRRLTKYPEHDRQERESELLLFLFWLPETSKYRRPGANGHPDGCTDRIMTFCPKRGYGASAGRFFSYVNLILLNHLMILGKKSELNPVTRKNTLRLNSEHGDQMELGGDVNESTCLQLSSGGLRYPNLEAKKVIDQVGVSRFFSSSKSTIPSWFGRLTSSLPRQSSRRPRPIWVWMTSCSPELAIACVFSHQSFTTGTAVPKQRRLPTANAWHGEGGRHGWSQ